MYTLLSIIFLFSCYCIYKLVLDLKRDTQSELIAISVLTFFGFIFLIIYLLLIIGVLIELIIKYLP
jgi:hypothetical protein